MKKVALNIAAIAMLFAASCSKPQEQPQPQSSGSNDQVQTAAKEAAIPKQLAYYDDELFTVNMKEQKDHVSETLIAHNKNINEIYASEDLDIFPQTFRPVISAIPGDGMNPMWLQFLIVFNAGHTPHQFFSDTEVEAAAESGEITLVNTGEVYRCSVVGKKPAQ